MDLGIRTNCMSTQRHLFDPIDHTSVSDAVVEQIERLIVDGVLKGGQKLPSEVELAEDMGVSRPKVREAIKILADQNLLSVRHGEGTFVNSLTGATVSPALVALFSRHPSAFYDYLEFRRELEGFAACAAAQRATREDKEILRRRLDDMEAQHLKPDAAQEAEVDVAFHLAIADAAHNSMLVHMMSSIYELMTRGVFYSREYLTETPATRDTLLDHHRAIAAGIFEGDPDAAAAAAEAHLNFVEEQFRGSDTRKRRSALARKRLTLLDQTKHRVQPIRHVTSDPLRLKG